MQETAPKHPMSKPFEYSLVCMIPRTLPTWNSSFCNTASGLQEQIFSQQFSGAWNFFSGISFLGFELLPASINRSQLHLHTPLSICTYWFKSRTFGGKEKVLKFWVKETHRHTHTHTHTHSQTLTILGEESRNQVKALKVKLNQFSLVIQLHGHYSGHQFS